MISGANCSDWVKGLNNTYIDNNKTKYGCQIQSPSKCMYKILGIIQDYTKIGGKNCTLINNKKMRDLILEYSRSHFINSTANIIGFPLTNKDPICFLDNCEGINNLYECVFKNLVDVNNEEIINKNFNEKMTEISIDFNEKGIGKLKIVIHFNKSLSIQRKLLEKNYSPYSNNILIIYIDSLSRTNTLRQLKKNNEIFRKIYEL